MAVVFEDQGVSLPGRQHFANGLICLWIMPRQVDETRYVSVIPNNYLKLSPGPTVETMISVTAEDKAFQNRVENPQRTPTKWVNFQEQDSNLESRTQKRRARELSGGGSEGETNYYSTS
ncbi:uncharacterized protein FPRO_13020 [Fusarium proliferatum ET1]|uniref:Uncharacterized protein n=1 Tax=Fusarium proliferatum (strain ET1) TaxID=1227346 RepID=A0A1L7W716_FUSPR|nr:uncharacterized protein FPRO_13020 [Fusarium proliferatum ET1]CZR48410.1 uncharacterized protein FPRO_13020 [Fusarium proliferatum ET1]